MPTDNTIDEAQQLETRLNSQFARDTAREQIRKDMCLTTKSTRRYSVACAGILVIHWLMSQRTNEMVSTENVELESPRPIETLTLSQKLVIRMSINERS